VRIGLSNATYLFTLFKKTYTETPQRYRERHGASVAGTDGGRG
jgi:YesN/AraC family two-component response regulator